MAMQLKECYESTKAILTSQKSNIRFINVPPLGSYKPLTDIKADWVVAAPENVGDCSAVAWYFAHFIQENLGVPVGIINASFGGSVVETWMSRETCQTLGDISVPEVSDATTEWEANIPTTMYNGMLNPIVGYGIQGCIWYQGESNVYNVSQYSDRLVAMVAEWRRKWGRNFPFYFTQIAPFDYTTWNVPSEVGEHVGAYLRDEQRRSMDRIENSGMAVILDVGEVEQIHPVRKEKVGERLGLMALAEVYDTKGFEYKSPTFERMEVDGDKAVIFFKDLYYGLTSYGKPLHLFEIADESKVFHPAEAYVDEERDVVVVSSKYVRNPKAVRYAFKNYVEPDISVICDPNKLTDRGCNGAPDWIIEIASPSSERMDYVVKQFKYRTAGVRKYWVIDKPLQKVTVFDFENDKFRNYDVENESVVNPHSRCIINRKS